MSKTFFLAFVFVLFLTANAREIFACDCIIWTSDNLYELVEDAYKESDVVFSGKVIEISKKTDSNIVKVKFKIEKSWKNISQNEVLLTTTDDDGSCGYKFEIKKKYLVYAHGKMNSLETNICTRTSSYEANKDLTFLNKIKKAKTKFSPK